MAGLWGNALKQEGDLNFGGWLARRQGGTDSGTLDSAILANARSERQPGVRFYLSGSPGLRRACGSGYDSVGAVSADLPSAALSARVSREPLTDGCRVMARVSRGVARHVNDLLMGILGQCALCRLDTPDSANLDTILRRIEDLVHYGAHLTFHLLGLCGRGVFADPPYVGKGNGGHVSAGVVGYAGERFRSYPFYHLSAALERRPLSGDAVLAACRQLSLEYDIVFKHLLTAVDDLSAEVPHRRSGLMRRLLLKGRRLMAEIAAYAGGDPRRRRGKDVSTPDTVAMILRSVLRNLSAHQTALHVNMSMGMSLPSVSMLPGDLRHVVAAVVKNAVEAMPFGGELTLTAAVHQGSVTGGDGTSGETLEIAVRDTGCGIPEHAGRRIFEPFFTMKEENGRLGLGLTGSIGRLRQVGGDLVVASAPGRGTLAVIRIPAVAMRRVDRGFWHSPRPVAKPSMLHCGY